MASGSSRGLQTIYMKGSSEEKSTFMFVLPEDQKPFQCGLCCVAFDINRELVTHVKAHLLTKPFQCGYCKISYETNFELKVHVKTHRLFVCVPQESGSALQNTVAQQQESDVKKVSQCRSELDAQNQEQLLTLRKRKGAYSQMSKASRLETDNKGLLTKNTEDASSESDVAGSEALRSKSSGVDVGNQKLMTATSFPPVKITRLDRDIGRLITKIKEEVSDTSDTRKPSTNSLSDGALDSLEMIVEDADDNDDLDDEVDNEWLPEDDGNNSHDTASKHYQRTTLQDSSSVTETADADASAEPNSTEHTPSNHRSMEVSDDDSSDSSKVVRHVQHSASGGDTSGQPFVCFLCGDGFQDSKDVGYHFRRLHKKGRDQVVLLPPNSGHEKGIASIGGDGDGHSQNRGAHKRFKCYVCQQKFKSRHDLSHHTLTVHPENDLRIYECGVCGRGFKMAHHVRDHFDARHGGGVKRIRRRQSNDFKFRLVEPSERRTRSCRSTDGSLRRSNSSSDACKPSADCVRNGASDSLAEDADHSVGLLDNDHKSECPSTDNGDGLCDLESTNDHADSDQLLAVSEKSARQSETTVTASSPHDFCDGLVRQVEDSLESLDKNAIQSGFEDNRKFSVTSHVDDRSQLLDTSSTTDTSTIPKPRSTHPPLSDHGPMNLNDDESVDPSQAGHYAQYSDNADKSFTPYVCSLCGDGFEDSKDVGSHFRSVHRQGKDQVVLYVSSPDHFASERDTDSLDDGGDDHSPDHDISKPFKCYICEEAFTFRHVLSRHILTEHRHKDLRVFECGVCGNKFKMAHHVKDHFDVRHGGGCKRSPRRHMYNHKFKLLHDSKPSMNSRLTAASSFLASEASSSVCNPSDHGFTDGALDSFEIAGEQSIFGDGFHNSDDKNKCIAADGEISGGCAGGEEQMDFEQLSAVLHNRTTDSEMKWTYADSGEDQSFRPFVCALCGDSFQDSKDVGHHFRRVHKKGKDGSVLCLPDHSPTDKDTTGHYGEDQTLFHESLQSFKCDVCKEAFKYRLEMSRHILTVHPEKDLRVFECGVCGVRFKLAHHLKDHFDACHGSGLARPHQCHTCGQKFKLLHHVRSHSYSCLLRHGCQTGLEDRPGESTVLKMEAASVSAPKSDRHLEHSNARKSPNKAGEKTVSMCHICGKSVHSYTALQSHILALHSDEKPHQCNLCPKAFKSKTSYDIHIKTHTKEKPYICEICGRSFATRSTFKCHKHTHTNAKPFQCEICQKGFNSYSGLGHHRLKHKKNKRHTCEECGKKFYTSGLLKNHAVTHTDLRPLSCKKCGKTYRSSSSLRYHMINTHPS